MMSSMTVYESQLVREKKDMIPSLLMHSIIIEEYVPLLMIFLQKPAESFCRLVGYTKHMEW